MGYPSESTSTTASTTMGMEDESKANQTSITAGPSDIGKSVNDNISRSIAASRAKDPNYGRVTETIDPKEMTNHVLGITSKNPFGYKGFMTRVFGIEPDNLDYTDIFSDSIGGPINAMNQIAGLNRANYNNPNNNPDIAGFDKNQPPNQPRSGIQKAFGSLFGRPTGQMTALGRIAAQRSANPMNPIAQSIFGLVAKGTPVGIISSLIGPGQSYAVKDSIGYDKNLDPAISGNEGLGTISDAISLGLTGNTTAGLMDSYDATKGIVSNAFTDASGKPATVDSTGTVNSVATGRTGIESLGLMDKDKDALNEVSNMIASGGYSGNITDNFGKVTSLGTRY